MLVTTAIMVLLLSSVKALCAPLGPITYSLQGEVTYNGSKMPDTTRIQPEITVWDVDAGSYVHKSLTITYSNVTGLYTISGLANKEYDVRITFLLNGARFSLPGNYTLYRIADLPIMTPTEESNFHFVVEYIMRQRDPWDNNAVDQITGEPYPRHSGIILFNWDPVPGADHYTIRVDKYRDPSHPDGWGFIENTYTQTSMIGTSVPLSLGWSSIGTFGNHYQVTYYAYNSSNVRIGYYMTTYNYNGYGWDYRFKVAPEYSGPIWYVKKDAAGFNNGSNWFSAFNSLQDAIDAAGADPDTDNEIWVAAETYYPDEGDNSINNDRESTFDLPDGVAIYGGFTGSETNRNQRDWNNNVTTLSGDLNHNDGPNFSNNSDNSYHVVRSSSNPGTTILDGFTVTGGNANGSNPENWGGGLLATSSDLVISNCRFQANTAGGGGGMYALYASGNPTILLTTFIGNVATGSGGAIAIQHSYPSFQSCLIMANEAPSGGGVYSLDNTGGPPEFTNCLFSGNTASSQGGALYQTGVGITFNPNPPILTNCTLANNSAITGAGGVMSKTGHASISNDAILDSCILWGNDRNGVVDEDAQVSLAGAAEVIKYTCIDGWTGALGGPGNIGDNPLFIDDDGFDDVFGTEDDNYRLLLNSPCIDTGNPGAGYEDPDGSRNDMGAYGGPLADQSGGVGSLPGSGFLFTTVGNIPTAFITEVDTNPDELLGTANLTPTEASQFHIHRYINTPFGSTVRLHGLFGAIDNVAYYEVLIAHWDGSVLTDSDFEPLTDTLTKTRYIYNSGTGKWDPSSIKIGPHPSGDRQLYIHTYEGFWSHLDLRLIWNTRRKPRGIYVLRCKSYSSSLVENTPSNAKDLIIRIDNTPVDATIHNVKYISTNPNHDPGIDGEILECAIIGLESTTENLRFNITASHPNGHLRYWQLDTLAGKNELRGLIAHESYEPSVDPYWFGVNTEEYQSINAPDPAPNPPGVLKDWKRCAYQFRLRAWANVTNGYSYIYWDEFDDHYYIDFDVAGCNRADINNDGVVNMLDMNIVARHWLETCPVVE